MLSSILSIYSAGQKVARMLGQKQLSNWSVFDGGDFDLVTDECHIPYMTLG